MSDERPGRIIRIQTMGDRGGRSPILQPPSKRCWKTKKRSFTSELRALAQLQEWEQTQSWPHRGKPYLCRFCSDWHITRDKPKERDA